MTDEQKQKARELAATLNGIADGAEWEVSHITNEIWKAPECINPIEYLKSGTWNIRLKPIPVEPVFVPLGPEDIPPFSVIRRKGQTDEYKNPQYWHWRQISYVTGIGPVCADRGYNWQELSTDYEINRSLASGKWDENAWEPCRKEAP